VSGYVILLFTSTTVPVFIGTILMLSGYLSGMAVFGAKIRELIPENMAGRFQGARIIGQVLIPGIIGPAIGAFALRNAEQIENSDGTYSFLPNKKALRQFANGLFSALSGLLLEGMFALSAGDGHLAYLSGKTQAAMTFGAFEILVLLGILEANKELLGVACEVLAQVEIFLVLGIAFFIVPGKNANHRPNICSHTQDRKQRSAGDAGKDRCNKAKDQERKAQFIRAMPSHHKSLDAAFDFLPDTHHLYFLSS